MSHQEEIVKEIARDQLGLSIYKGIVEGAQSPDDIVRVFRGRIVKDDRLRKRFDSIFTKVLKSGLKNYRELLRNFEGKGILDPIKEGKLDLSSPKLKGAFLREYNDFGFVSLAKHPFDSTGDWVVIYAAGRHGPATSHGISWLSKKDVWEKRPCGGVFEVQMDTTKSFSEKFQDITIVWDTDEYSLQGFSTKMLEENRQKEVSIFISTPLRYDDTNVEKNTRWLAKVVEDYYRKQGKKVICKHPYALVSEGEWNYVNGILKHFPLSRYIVHDITGFSPGVIFEVGCSIGLNKRFVLIWNTEDQPFLTKQLPQLIKRTDITQVQFVRNKQVKKKLEEIFNSIDSVKLISQCPGFPRRESGNACSFHSETKSASTRENEVFIVVSNKWRKLQNLLLEEVRRQNHIPRLPKDFPDQVDICQICRGIASCDIIIVDVTDNDMNGLLTLGMARARERRSLQLFKEGFQGSSMFDGQSQQWREETLENDLNNALIQLLAKE